MIYENEKNQKTVFGIFEKHEVAEATLKELIDNKFKPAEISLLMPSHIKSKDSHLRTEEVVAGGILGSLLSGAMVLATTAGALLAAGPILAVVGGASIAAGAGGIVGTLITKALVGYGVSTDEAIKYIDVIQNGNLLMCVHVTDSDTAYKALEILKNHNAKDISLQKNNIAKSNWTNEPAVL